MSNWHNREYFFFALTYQIVSNIFRFTFKLSKLVFFYFYMYMCLAITSIDKKSNKSEFVIEDPKRVQFKAK